MAGIYTFKLEIRDVDPQKVTIHYYTVIVKQPKIANGEYLIEKVIWYPVFYENYGYIVYIGHINSIFQTTTFNPQYLKVYLKYDSNSDWTELSSTISNPPLGIVYAIYPDSPASWYQGDRTLQIIYLAEKAPGSLNITTSVKLVYKTP